MRAHRITRRRVLLGGAGALFVGSPALARPLFLRGGGGGPPEPLALHSVWTGSLATDGVTISTRLSGDDERDVSLRVATNAGLTENAEWSDTVVSTGRIAKHTLTGLEPDTQYYYAAALDGVPSSTVRGRFKTLPAGENVSFQFNACSCASTGTDNPIFTTMRTFDGSAPLFNLHMGDLHYNDYSGTTDATRQANYDAVFASPTQASLYANVPTIYVWDDHDYCGNFSHVGTAGRDSARRAYRARVPSLPVLTGATDEIHQVFQVGRVRFLLTDLRSTRTINTATDDASKTMMGAGQKQWFKDQLDQSNPANQGVYFIWVPSMPWHFTTTANEDSWAGYNTERVELADFMKAQGLEGRVSILSGDMHGLGIDAGANADYATSAGMDIPVFQCGGMRRAGSSKGGPYSLGTAFGNVFGNIEVIDGGGSTITIRWRAVSTVTADGTPTVRLDANTDGISHEFTSAAL